MSLNQPKIFISHSREDKPLVRRLEKELQAAGAEVWVDHEGIRGGDNLPERISEALEWCNTLVLVWTKAASQSDWVKLEWSNAISLKKAIIPCRVDNAALPAILAHKAYVGFNDVEAGIAQLLQALRLSKAAPSAKIEQVVQPSPRVSHSPFQETMRPPAITKPSVEKVLRLRSTPATLSKAEVKAMLRKYDFYCEDDTWAKDWSNPQGKGIGNKFELQQNGQVVFDHATGLMWQQSAPPEWMTFARAEEYVRDANQQRFAGFNDWRLPTLEEAMSLMAREKKTDGFYLDPVFDRNQSWIWTVDKASASSCWVVIFSRGYCTVPLLDYRYHVRLVR